MLLGCALRRAYAKEELNLGMLIENRKSGFRFQNRNPVFGFENRFSNLFFKLSFPIKNLLIAEKK